MLGSTTATASAGGSNTSAEVGPMAAARVPSVSEECEKLTQELQHASIKELRTVFPSAVQRIFQRASCLQLSVLNRTSRGADFLAARSLLAPGGPVLQAAGRLVADSTAAFSVPRDELPAYIQIRLSPNSAASASYLASRLSHSSFQADYPSPTHTSRFASSLQSVLRLNAFEYFLLWFLLYPVKNSSGLSTSAALSGRSDDGLYSLLLTDYLNHLLPSSGEVEPLASYAGPVSRSPHSGHSAGGPPHSSLRRRPQHAAALSYSPPAAQHVWDQRDSDTWRSTCFAQLLCEVWMGWGRATNTNNLCSYIDQEQQLPSTDLVLLTRSFIKHCHLCSSMAPLPHLQQSSMDALRGKLFKKYVLRSALSFTSHLFDKWPLDSSFKIVLELWLSLVQPWRYTQQALTERARDAVAWKLSQPLDEAVWFPFVLESLPCYSLLHSLLLRLQHMDLRVTRSAALLYRAAKLLSTPNLGRLIRAAEKSVSLSSASQAAANSSMATVTQEVTELLPPGVSYAQLFSIDTQRLVQRTIASIERARQTPLITSSASSGLLRWLGLDLQPPTDGQDPGQLQSYLSDAKTWLVEFFEIDASAEENRSEISFAAADESLLSSTSRSSFLRPPDLRKAQVSFSGDPELQPIRSYEYAFLVRLLYILASALNRKFGASLTRWYGQQGFRGHLLHQLLQPPFTPARLNQSGLSSSLHLTWMNESAHVGRGPVLSLRWVGSQVVLVWLAIYLLFTWLFLGLSSPIALLLLLLIAALLLALRAAVYTVMGTPVQ